MLRTARYSSASVMAKPLRLSNKNSASLENLNGAFRGPLPDGKYHSKPAPKLKTIYTKYSYSGSGRDTWIQQFDRPSNKISFAKDLRTYPSEEELAVEKFHKKPRYQTQQDKIDTRKRVMRGRAASYRLMPKMESTSPRKSPNPKSSHQIRHLLPWIGRYNASIDNRALLRLKILQSRKINMVEEIEKLTGQLLQEIKDFQSSCDDNMIRIGVDVVEQALGMKIDQLQNDYEIPILNSNDAYQLEAVTRLSREILKNPRDRLKLDDTKSISLEPIVMKKQRRQSTKVRTKFSKPPSIDTAALSQMAGKSYLRKLYRNVVTGIETQTLANQVTTLETKQIQLEGISKENEKTVADLRASLAASEKRNQELEMTIIKLKASQSGDEDLQRKHQELQNKLSRKRTKLADVMLEALWKDNDNLLVMKENDKLKTAIRTINEDNNRYRTSHEKLKDLYLEDSTTWDEKQNALLTEISRLNSSTRELQKLLNEKSKELADIELAKAYNFISIGTNTSFKEYSEGLDTTKKYASIDDSPQQTSRSASPNNSLGKNQLSPIGRYINKGKSPKRTYNSSPLGQSSTTTLENRHAGGRCHYHTHKDLGSTSLRRGTYFGTYQPDSPEFSEAQSCQSLAELQLHWKKSLRKHSDSSGSPPRTERKRIPEDYKKYVPSIQRSTSRQEVKARLNEAIRNQVTRRRKNKYSTKNVTTN